MSFHSLMSSRGADTVSFPLLFSKCPAYCLSPWWMNEWKINACTQSPKPNHTVTDFVTHLPVLTSIHGRTPFNFISFLTTPLPLENSSASMYLSINYFSQVPYDSLFSLYFVLKKKKTSHFQDEKERKKISKIYSRFC